MFKKISLIVINAITLVIFFASLFIYIDQGNYDLARWMIHLFPGLTIINLILVVILLVFNNLALGNNKLLVDSNNNLKLSLSIILYSLNIINLVLVIYALSALVLKLPGF